MCRDEAQALCNLKSEFSQSDVPLVAVLHETLGAEEFKSSYFTGPLYLDVDKTFFGPKERRMGLWGFLRWDVWMNVIKSVKTGNEGNLKGDGTLLGGVYVIGAGDQGVLYHHQEAVWGDHFNKSSLLKAVSEIGKKK